MNPDRIRALADRIDNLPDPDDYDHDEFGHYRPERQDDNDRPAGCAAPCNVAGHAVLMMHDSDRYCQWQDDMHVVNVISAKAGQYLQLDDATMLQLVEWHPVGSFVAVTPSVVAAMLRLLAQTGAVRWDEAHAICYPDE